MEQPQQLLHFCDSKHPLVFIPDYRWEEACCGCRESVYGPSYCCTEGGCPFYTHHKSCAELPLGLHHPLHPAHPLILFDEKTDYPEEIEKTKCELCKKTRLEYTYRCSRCDFNLHARCASLSPTMESEVHHHPLTPFLKWITFTCDSVAKKARVPPICVAHAFFGFMQDVLLCRADSKFYVTSTPSTLPILLLKLNSINHSLDFVSSVFKK